MARISRPSLVLDGTVVGTATDVAAGAFSSLQIVVTHNAYPSGFANQTVFLSSFCSEPVRVYW
jgi:hypothetical protein